MSLSLRDISIVAGNRLADVRVCRARGRLPLAHTTQLWAVLHEAAQMVHSHASLQRLSDMVLTPDTIGLVAARPVFPNIAAVLERRGTVSCVLCLRAPLAHQPF